MFYKMFSIFCLFIVLSVTKIECLEEMEFRNEQPRTLNFIKKDVSSWILGKICNISGWIFHHFSKLCILKFSKDKLACLANEQHNEESDNWHIGWMFQIYQYTTYSAFYVGIVFDLLPVYEKFEWFPERPVLSSIMVIFWVSQPSMEKCWNSIRIFWALSDAYILYSQFHPEFIFEEL